MSGRVLFANIKGPKGDDAYQVAVANGFQGTETEWLESLKGAKGDSAYQQALDEGFVGTRAQWLASLKGSDGADSEVPGPPGPSAYQVAVSEGFSGTEAEWLASLKGSKGDPGDDSTVPGPSAYQVAVVNGFSGTEAEWLASLKGSDGADSEVPGPPGSSAYQVAVSEGFSGTEAEWLSSLKGDKGDPGDGIPSGGTAGQVLKKASAADLDVVWGDGGGAGNLKNLGDWVAGSYSPGDVVQHNGYTFVCEVATSKEPIPQTQDLIENFAALPATSAWAFAGPGAANIGILTDLTPYGAPPTGVTRALYIPGSTSADNTVTLTVTVGAGGGTVTFYDAWNAESSDSAYFAIDGSLRHWASQGSELTPWTARSYSLSAGTHTLMWLMHNDSTVVHGQNRYAVAKLKVSNAPQGSADWRLIGSKIIEESVRDLIGSTLYAGSAITLTNDDDGDTVTVAAKTTKSINEQTGTAYTLDLTDAGFDKFLTLNNAAAITLTVPTNASKAFPVGSYIEGAQLGAGQVTIAPAAGVTLQATPGLKLDGQYSTFGLLKIATDTWLVMGRLSA